MPQKIIKWIKYEKSRIKFNTVSGERNSAWVQKSFWEQKFVEQNSFWDQKSREQKSFSTGRISNFQERKSRDQKSGETKSFSLIYIFHEPSQTSCLWPRHLINLDELNLEYLFRFFHLHQPAENHNKYSIFNIRHSTWLSQWDAEVINVQTQLPNW